MRAGERVVPSHARGRAFVIVVLGLALVLRTAVVLADRGYQPINDALHFDLLATSIAHGDGYQPALFDLPSASAYRAPLYPTSLAAVWSVAGDHSFTAGRIANGMIGTVLVALIGIVAVQLWGRRAGAVALVLAAVHPTLILHGSSLMSEPLLATCIVGATAAALQCRRSDGALRWALAAGAAVGLAALTRETGFLLVPGVVLLVGGARPGGWSWRAPALVLGATLLVVAPWTARNAVQLDSLVPVSTSGGYSFAGTYNRTAMDNERDPAIWIPPQDDPHLADVMRSIESPTEVELDRALRAESVTYVREHPGDVPKALFWNTVRFFDLQGPRSAVEYAQFVPYSVRLTRTAVYASWAVGALALAGLAAGATRRTPLGVWIFPILAFALHIALSANIRYRAVLEPFTVLLAAFAVSQVIGFWRSNSRRA